MREGSGGRQKQPYIARFAGDIFLHENNPADGPALRRLASEVAWKRPPSASVRAEVST